MRKGEQDGMGRNGVEPVEQWLIETFENTNKTTMWGTDRLHSWPTLHGGISNAVPAIIFAFFCLVTADLNVNIRVNNTGVPCIPRLQGTAFCTQKLFSLMHYTIILLNP